MRRDKCVLFSTMALAIGAISILSSSNVLAATVVVSPGNMNGWSFFSADSNGDAASGIPYTNAVGQLVNGPSSPPLGTGSAQLATGAGGGDGAERLINNNFNGTLLSSITALGYSTYDTVNNGQQFPYLQLNVSYTVAGNPTNDSFFFEPPYQQPSTGNPALPDQGATVLNQWQSWNAFVGGWWNNNADFNPGAGPGGVGSLAALIALHPDATIEGGIKFNVGFASAADNFNGYVDAFSIGTAAGTTTFDFEAVAVPEPASLSLAAFGLLGLAGYAVARYRKQSADRSLT
jgi:hypothetical protein